MLATFLSSPRVFATSEVEVIALVSVVALLVSVLLGVYQLWKRHNCHVCGCWRIQWKAVQGTDHVLCRHHHPDDAPTHLQVLEDRKAARVGLIRKS